MTWTWVEPFAGAAACALRLVGGERLKPPVAWMGGKRRLARAILDAMGVPEEPPARVLLADAGPWGWVWPLLLDPSAAARVTLVLRSWAGEHPRELWQRLASRPPAEDLHERAAQWLWLQARSASGVPIWWDGWRLAVEGRAVPQSTWDRFGEDNAGRWRAADHGTGRDTPAGQSGRGERAGWLASDGRGQPRPAGARAVGGRWEAPNGRGTTSKPGFNTGQASRDGREGSWRFDARPGDRAPDRAAGMSGWTKGNKGRDQDAANGQRGRVAGRTGGMVNPATIAARIEALAEAFARVDWGVDHGDAASLPPPGGWRRANAARGCWAYLDPPYVGATGYGWDLPRAEVLELARRWADAGAVVAVSEAEPLELPGWHHLELTREGGKPEWLTLSRAPARVPARQGVLFTEGT